MKKNILFVTLILLLAFPFPLQAQEGTTITIVHFSDYHSHAVPFYAEGQANTAGLARAMAYLDTFADDPNALIFNGGDTINRGAPAWSDKYQCAEWPMFNGIVDAMAYGNHDADYGPDVFAQCKTLITYPILGSNVLDSSGQPLFQYDGKTYKVFKINTIKIGVFALVGSDFEKLVKAEYRPAAGATFSNTAEEAQKVVKALREQEHVNAVVLIGHGLFEEDLELAKSVPGIDLILGTHSHRKEALTQIPGTNTYIISPFQYLTYIDKVELTFNGGKLTNVKGELVRMSNDRPEDPDVAKKVNAMQADLKADPKFASFFEPIGQAGVELSTEGQFTGEAVLGNFVTDVVRDAAKVHMVIATSSSFREPIPPGPLVTGDLLTAMPYKNQILIYDLKGEHIQELLNYSLSRQGSDFFSQVSGVRFNVDGGQAVNIQILNNPSNPQAGYSPLDPAKTYQVATSDFQGKLAGGYKDIFGKGTFKETDIEVRDQVQKFIRAHSPVSARLDGRITIGAAAQPTPAAKPTPATLPVTGGSLVPPFRGVLYGAAAAFGIILVLAGACIVIVVTRRKPNE